MRSNAMLVEETNEESVGDAIYRRLRHDIVFGNLKPGQRLRLEGLRAQYGSSVTTLREALSKLASEGLVTAEGLRGFQVTQVSARNLHEIAGLRLLLESHAMTLSFATGDMEWEGRLVSAHHKLARTEEKLLAGDFSCILEWKQYDSEFHTALIANCRSDELMLAHKAAFDKYLRYQMVALNFRGKIASEEHSGLLQAALNRNANRAIEILRVHIEGGVAEALEAGTISD